MRVKIKEGKGGSSRRSVLRAVAGTDLCDPSRPLPAPAAAPAVPAASATERLPGKAAAAPVPPSMLRVRHRAQSRAQSRAHSTHGAAGWRCRGKEGAAAAAGAAPAPAPSRCSGAPGSTSPQRCVYKGKAQGSSRVWAPILPSLSSIDSCFPEAATGISAVTLSRLQEEKASLCPEHLHPPPSDPRRDVSTCPAWSDP